MKPKDRKTRHCGACCEPVLRLLRALRALAMTGEAIVPTWSVALWSGLLAMTIGLHSSFAAETAELKYTGWKDRDPLDNSVVLEKLVPQIVEPIVEKKEEAAFPTGRYNISAIVWGSGRPQAIVNNKIVNIGERLEDGEIVRIDKMGLHINFEGREVLLEIK